MRLSNLAAALLRLHSCPWFPRRSLRKPRPHEGHGDANEAVRKNAGKIGA